MVEKPLVDAAFEALITFIQEHRGFDFRGYKRTSLRRRIALRMEGVGVDSFAGYQARLEADPGEFESLLDTVLINVTSFFRDTDAWTALREQVIPAVLAEAGPERPIRVWSVGCASGQEPFSIAMAFAEVLGVSACAERVKIYATDLDEDALRLARLATYSPREVEDVPPDMLARHFERTNNHYVFHRDLRRCVIFGRHNVVRDAPISRIDLLVCRNLLIYLEAETQDVVLPRLHYSLLPTGFLFLGKAETQMARSQLFKPVDARHRIFQKVVQDWRRSSGGGLTSVKAYRSVEAPTAANRMLEAVLNEATAAILVIDELGCVALANAAARRLLNVGEADIGRPFQDLPVSYRPLELRGPMEEVTRTQRPLRLDHQEFHVSQGEAMRLTIDIRLLFRTDSSPFSVMLTFTDTTRLHAMQRELEATQENLQNSIEELQSANEELETTNEELQSTNEELETTNEELQSTNEELETINEESRSTAEEMESSNEELRIQTEQAVSNELHLKSVLRSLNVGITVLDGSMVIESWNRWNENTWGVRSEEAVGTPFEALDIGFPVHSQRERLQQARAGESVPDQLIEGVDRRGRPILCRVRLAPLAEDGERSAGLVVMFEDVTTDRRRDDYEHYLGRVMGKALNEIYFLDPQTLRFVLGNRGAEQKLGCSMHQLQQVTLPDILPGSTTAELQAMVAPLLAKTRPEVVFETRIVPLTGNSYPAEICLQYFSDEQPPILVAMVHDTTDRIQLATGT